MKRSSVSIKGARESAKEFVEAWPRGDQGKPAEQPIERLYFEDLPTMLKVLTPGRLEVLKVLHQAGPLRVRALAGRMERDHKNVNHDLQVLERVGLVDNPDNQPDFRDPRPLVRSTEGKLTAPWTKIVAEIALAA
jgi:predicted transcriptional regulator